MESYVEMALDSYESRASFHRGYIHCRCPVCGDSDKNKRKKRGYILKNNPKDPDVWVFHCHNGACEANNSISVTNLLKWKFPDIYRSYLKEVFAKNRNDKPIPKKIVAKVEVKYNEKNDTKYFVPILDRSEPLFEKAKSYCIERKIPENVWHKFYVCVDGRYKDRLIIPFYNKKEIYYYQARSLVGQEPKYLNRKTDSRPAYNIHNIDKAKEVMVTEGPIDSMFLENAIAVLGVKFSEQVEEELNKLNCFYIWDNDKTGKIKAIEYLRERKFVFNWKKFLKDNDAKNCKDINDYIISKDINKLSYIDLKPYFTNNIWDKVWFV